MAHTSEPCAFQRDEIVGAHLLTSQQRRELAIDTMASWALEGMKPNRETVKDINSYLDGGMTLEEFIAKSKALYLPAERGDTDAPRI